MRLAATRASVAGYLAAEEGAATWRAWEVNASHQRAVSGGRLRAICMWVNAVRRGRLRFITNRID
ncbi:hypothetical protein ACQV2E_01050 [Pantoea allii]|uniref:hypothetical protein n=1 Tax=Pantoea allii TaxID=574096 RepID=UPI003D321293